MEEKTYNITYPLGLTGPVAGFLLLLLVVVVVMVVVLVVIRARS
jgi:uncharacterized membrane protein